jgi:hypothetical protein
LKIKGYRLKTVETIWIAGIVENAGATTDRDGVQYLRSTPLALAP